MINAVGYNVSYHRSAFRTSVEPDGIRPDKLEEVLEGLAQSVLRVSRGRWIIIPRDAYISHLADTTIDLVVYVPAGGDQYEQALTAVSRIEQGFESFLLTLPIDKSLRIIEEGGPKCEDCESRTIDWIRTTPYAGNERYFCDRHAELQSDFGGNAATNPDNFMYVRQHPLGVRIDS